MPYEQQFYKVRLVPGGTLRASGILNVHHFYYSVNFYIDIYDDQSHKTQLMWASAAANSAKDRANGRDTPYQSGTFTNNSAEPRDFHVVVRATPLVKLDSYSMTIQADLVCPMPTGETVSAVGWSDYWYVFRQQLLPPTGTPAWTFTGRTVRETDTSDGTKSIDWGNTCWFPESSFPERPALSGSDWPNLQGSTYDDTIGMSLIVDPPEIEISYYRRERAKRGLAPDCEQWVYQIMWIDQCGAGPDIQYDQHLIQKLILNTVSEWIGDIGVQKTPLLPIIKPWP
jgi:hypothetical protein